MRTRHLLITLLAGILTIPAAADVDRGTVRIAWDKSTYQEMSSAPVCNADYSIEPNLYYPRAKHLSDGSILLTFMNDHFGFDIYTRKSKDGGKTWSDAKLIRLSYSEESTVGKDKRVFVNPEFHQLKSGRILLAWQWRYIKGYNDLPNTNQNCGVEMCWSDDLGETWSEPREVYRGRNWEPAFAELPSGEIHMYITDSQQIRDGGSYAATSLLRSFDGGKTWQGKELATNKDVEIISRTIWNGRGMDGMATAVILDDGKGIVAPIETWSGRDVYEQSPNLIRTTMEQNWRCDTVALRANGGPDFPYKKQIHKDIKGFGPYSCKLSTGEVVILTNGRWKDVGGVFAVVGDRMGDNFSYITTAFSNGSAYWGSIDEINPNELMATATIRSNAGPMPAAGDATVGVKPQSRGKIVIIKGWLNRSREIKKGALKMQKVSSFNPEGLWMLGKVALSKVYADFGYDSKYFYFGSYLFDKDIAAFAPQNSDAGGILLSRPGKGTFKVVVNAKGDYTVYKEVRSSWQMLLWEYGKAETELVCTVNDDSDEDIGYSALVKLPWSLIGGAPVKGEKIAVHQIHYHKNGVAVKSGIRFEETEGENSDYPGEWLTITLK